MLLKAAFAVDLLRGLHFSVIAANLALGTLLIPICHVVFAWFTQRFGNAPAFQRLVEDASGTSFSAARASFESEANFESGLANSDTQAALAQQRQNQWPAPAEALLQHLRRSILGSIWFFVLLLALIASFNLLHGGNAHALIPGIFLHLFFVTQMVAGIVHRQLLGNLGSASALPLAAQIQILEQTAQRRGKLARLSLVLTPWLALALAQVLTSLSYASDLYASPGPGVAIILLAAALAFALALYRWRAMGMRFAPGSSNVLVFNALRLTQQLLARLQH